MGTNLGWPLRRAAGLFPAKPAVHDGERSLTFAQVHSRIQASGGWLDRTGIALGARFGYLGANSLEHLECVLGVPAHGRVLVDLNWRLAVEELVFMVGDAEVVALAVDRANLDVGRELRDRCPSLRTLVFVDQGEEEDCVPYRDLVSGPPGPVVDPGEDALAAISYTGGTTGRPKGVMLTHENLIANAQHNLMTTRPAADDTFIHACPMFHAAGVANVFASVWVGAGNVIVPRFEPRRFVEEVERHRVTLAILVPTMIGMLLDHLAAEGGDLSSLRNLQYAASPISPELQRRVVTSLPCEIAQFYGMTEAAPTVTSLSPEDHARGVAGEDPFRARLNSVGVPVPGVEAEVRRPDGSTAETEEVGEIWVRGRNVMQGYWNLDEETRKVFAGGWYKTGDLAYADADGYLHLVDRLKDMLVTGGENVYSVEVERTLQLHPGIREAAVFGIPDERWGEAVHAIVVPTGDPVAEDELIAHCRSHLAGFKVPRSMEFRQEPLPTSGAGKVLKGKLRETFWTDRKRRLG